MSSIDWFAKLAQTFSLFGLRPVRKSSRHPQRVLLSLEGLEDRTLLSAGFPQSVLLPQATTLSAVQQAGSIDSGESSDSPEEYLNSDPLQAGADATHHDSAVESTSSSEDDEYPIPPASSSAQRSSLSQTSSPLPVLLPLKSLLLTSDLHGATIPNLNFKPMSDTMLPPAPVVIRTSKLGMPAQPPAGESNAGSTASTLGFGSVQDSARDRAWAVALLFDLTSWSNSPEMGTMTNQLALEHATNTVSKSRQDEIYLERIPNLKPHSLAISERLEVFAHSLQLPTTDLDVIRAVRPSPTASTHAPQLMEAGAPVEQPPAISQTREGQNQCEAASPNAVERESSVEPIPNESSQDRLLFATLLVLCFGLASGYGCGLRPGMPDRIITPLT